MKGKTLATDLDGTLIPNEESPSHREALGELEAATSPGQGDLRLIFVTGRHLGSILEVKQKAGLPRPEIIIADVGTSLYRPEGESWRLDESYAGRLREITDRCGREPVLREVRNVSDIRLQKEENQGAFKISFECRARDLDRLTDQLANILERAALPYRLISSVDPFTRDGMVDILPAGVSKFFAVEFLLQSGELEADSVVFAGDSGNDLAVFRSPLRSIVVGNADERIRALLRKEHPDRIREGLIYFAEGDSTIGVCEGCHHFHLLG